MELSKNSTPKVDPKVDVQKLKLATTSLNDGGFTNMKSQSKVVWGINYFKKHVFFEKKIVGRRQKSNRFFDLKFFDKSTLEKFNFFGSVVLGQKNN